MATDGQDQGSDRESRLYQLIGDYYAAVAAGNAPDQKALLELHPDLAESLNEFFLEQDRFHRATEPLRDVADTLPRNGPPDLTAGDKVAYFGDYELLGEIAGRHGSRLSSPTAQP